MDDTKSNHKSAMDAAEQGFTHKRNGNIAEAIVCFRRAYYYEQEALRQAQAEPSRSILFDSLMNIRDTIAELERGE